MSVTAYQRSFSTFSVEGRVRSIRGDYHLAHLYFFKPEPLVSFPSEATEKRRAGLRPGKPRSFAAATAAATDKSGRNLFRPALTLAV